MSTQSAGKFYIADFFKMSDGLVEYFKQSEDITVGECRHRNHPIGVGLRPDNVVGDVKAFMVGGEGYKLRTS